jgi:hypothetical protein
VLAAGGYIETQGTEELFDGGTGTWSSTGALITERMNHTVTLLQNGMVLVAGGLEFAYGAQLHDCAVWSYSHVSSQWYGLGGGWRFLWDLV